MCANLKEPLKKSGDKLQESDASQLRLHFTFLTKSRYQGDLVTDVCICIASEWVAAVEMHDEVVYRAPGKCLYVVARNFFLHLLNCSVWPCLGPA